MQGMNVIIIGPAYPLRGGLATYNERLARAFAEAGDTARIVTFSLQYPDFLFPGQTQFSTGPAPDDLAIEVSLNSVNPLSWLAVGRKLRRQRPAPARLQTGQRRVAEAELRMARIAEIQEQLGE